MSRLYRVSGRMPPRASMRRQSEAVGRIVSVVMLVRWSDVGEGGVGGSVRWGPVSVPPVMGMTWRFCPVGMGPREKLGHRVADIA